MQVEGSMRCTTCVTRKTTHSWPVLPNERAVAADRHTTLSFTLQVALGVGGRVK